MYYNYDIRDKLVKLAEKTEKKIQPIFENIDRICMLNSAKVLHAFQEERVTTTDFMETTNKKLCKPTIKYYSVTFSETGGWLKKKAGSGHCIHAVSGKSSK